MLSLYFLGQYSFKAILVVCIIFDCNELTFFLLYTAWLHTLLIPTFNDILQLYKLTQLYLYNLSLLYEFKQLCNATN